MFSIREFLMTGLRSAVGKQEDYQVVLNAAAWNEKGVLTSEDLAELQSMIEIKNTPPALPEGEEEG